MESVSVLTAEPPQPIQSISDGHLVARAQQGHGEAREELARRFRRPAYLFAFQLLGHREEALDVAQDSMLRFFRTLARFDPDRPVIPWLFRIVRNRVIDLARRRRPTESIDDPAAPHSDPPAPPEANPETLAHRRDLQRQLWRAVHRLTRRQREILILRDYQDLSYAEIAAVLDIPQGTVMSRLHAARKALSARVRARLGGDDV